LVAVHVSGGGWNGKPFWQRAIVKRRAFFFWDTGLQLLKIIKQLLTMKEHSRISAAGLADEINTGQGARGDPTMPLQVAH
jgi:hypothetical protein